MAEGVLDVGLAPTGEVRRTAVRILSESSNRNLPTATERGGPQRQTFRVVVASFRLLGLPPRG
jgi:hypothetical protein